MVLVSRDSIEFRESSAQERPGGPLCTKRVSGPARWVIRGRSRLRKCAMRMRILTVLRPGERSPISHDSAHLGPLLSECVSPYHHCSPVTDQSDPSIDYARRHLRLGWWSIFVFAGLGLLLESFHGFKLGAYLDVSNETRRLMWRLAH